MSDTALMLHGMGSVAVGQQRLVEAPPARRLVVPVGHGSWWGVDPSTVRVSVAYVDAKGSRDVRTASFPRSEGVARLSDIYRETRLFVQGLLFSPARGIAPDFPDPGVVLIEQPSGKFEKPTLSYAVGVIQAAVHDGLRDALGRAPHIEMVTSSHWKKVACGSGDIYKPKTQNGYYGVLDWARMNGYRGSSWDEADALAIAECARREITLEQR